MKSLKRQKLHIGGELKVVATPIGNLGDISTRAVETLKNSHGILCEDTRVARKLLSHFEIKTKLERFDAHTTLPNVNRILDRIAQDETWSLVTDAGTPAISDPGGILVEHARQRGIRVSPIPGPSSLSAFLSASGYQGTKFTFRGFYPREKAQMSKELSSFNASSDTGLWIWLESPRRIERTLEDWLPFSEIHWIIAKEITKIHEEFFSGSMESILQTIRTRKDSKIWSGEWIMGAISPQKPITSLNKSDSWQRTLACLIDAHVSASQSVEIICRNFPGAPKNKVYEAALELKESLKS